MRISSLSLDFRDLSTGETVQAVQWTGDYEVFRAQLRQSGMGNHLLGRDPGTTMLLITHLAAFGHLNLNCWMVRRTDGTICKEHPEAFAARYEALS